MRALAETRPDDAAILKKRAAELDEASAGFYADPQTVDVKKFMGAWARARRLWCDCTGEPLI